MNREEWENLLAIQNAKGKGWADEVGTQIFAVPALENFYLLASLQFGDPRSMGWIEATAQEFYKLWNVYQNNASISRVYDGAEVMLQYIDWYEKNGPAVDKPRRKRT